MMMRFVSSLSLVASLALAASAAHAHVILQNMEGTAGYQEYVTLVVPHGCGASPTTRLRVRIPDGIDILVPEDTPGWDLEIVTRKLDTPIRGDGGTLITEVADEVIWTGGMLPPDRLGRFTMLVRMPDAPGRIMYFRTIQTCTEGESRWIDTVEEGEPAWKIWATEHPSPFIELKPAERPQLGATMQEIFAERERRNSRGAAQ